MDQSYFISLMFLSPSYFFCRSSTMQCQHNGSTHQIVWTWIVTQEGKFSWPMKTDRFSGKPESPPFPNRNSVGEVIASGGWVSWPWNLVQIKLYKANSKARLDISVWAFLCHWLHWPSHCQIFLTACDYERRTLLQRYRVNNHLNKILLKIYYISTLCQTLTILFHTSHLIIFQVTVESRKLFSPHHPVGV